MPRSPRRYLQTCKNKPWMLAVCTRKTRHTRQHIHSSTNHTHTIQRNTQHTHASRLIHIHTQAHTCTRTHIPSSPPQASKSRLLFWAVPRTQCQSHRWLASFRGWCPPECVRTRVYVCVAFCQYHDCNYGQAWGWCIPGLSCLTKPVLYICAVTRPVHCTVYGTVRFLPYVP